QLRSETAEAVLRELGYDPATLTLAEAEAILKDKLVTLHPDATGAQVASSDYHRVNQALEEVRASQRQTALVPLDQTRALADFARELVRELRPPVAALPSRGEVAAQVKKAVSEAQSGAKIASASAFAVASALFALLGQETHPVVRAIT